MVMIRAYSIGDAHEQIVKRLFERGHPVVTENGEWTLELDDSSMIYIENPLSEPMVSSGSRFSRGFMQQYAKDLIEGSSAVFEYDYNERLYHYRPFEEKDENNQIDYIIKKLKKNPQSRRAIAITWYPYSDQALDDAPCLQLVQCLVRNDEKGNSKLKEKVVFRSNDMLTAGGANMFALVNLQKSIADHLGVGLGSYEHISLIEHIYPKRDISDLEPFLVPRLVSKNYFDERMNFLHPIYESLESDMYSKGQITRK